MIPLFGLKQKSETEKGHTWLKMPRIKIGKLVLGDKEELDVKETLERIEQKIDSLNIAEVVDYDPKKDTLALFVGTEDNIPPQEFMEKIYHELKDLHKRTFILAPGIFKIIVLKNKKIKK